MRILVPAPSNSITLSAPIDPSSNSTNAGPTILLLSRFSVFACVAVFDGLGVNEVSIPGILGLSKLALRAVTAIALLSLPVLVGEPFQLNGARIRQNKLKSCVAFV